MTKNMPTACTLDSFELTRWVASLAVPAMAGLFGVLVGSLLTARREQKQRQLSFLEQQLQQFYSDILGIRAEILMRSEIRAKVQNAASSVWPKLCEEARDRGGSEAVDRVREKRWPEFQRLIEYDNKQLVEELLPLYRRMVERFRTHYWLAEPDTRYFYSELVEFVELWNRWIEKSIPVEVITVLDHGEERLSAFYTHLEQKHNALREKVRLANV